MNKYNGLYGRRNIYNNNNNNNRSRYGWNKYDTQVDMNRLNKKKEFSIYKEKFPDLINLLIQYIPKIYYKICYLPEPRPPLHQMI